MRRFKKIIFVLILIGIFIELLIIVPQRIKSFRGSSIADVAKKLEEEKSFSKAEGIHIVESQKGNRDFELFAKTAEGQQGVGTWNLFDMKINYYNLQIIDYVVTGEKGFIDGQSKDMDVQGNVKTISKNGYQFRTDSIHYRAEDRQITSPDKVIMLGPRDKDGAGIKLTGKSMVVDVEKNIMLIQQNIRAEKELSAGKMAIITSDRAEFFGNNQKAHFVGNVKMSYNEMVIVGPEATFDYATGADFLSAVQFRGGVQFVDKDKSATSQEIKMNLRSQEVVLDGNPQVIQDQDELRGERIIFLEGGKKVKVEKVRAQMAPECETLRPQNK